jgi:tetratricopeptide (TPR) repeat protein
LKKAEKYQKSNLTLIALGNVSFEVKDYEEASKNFRQACELKSDYATVYNLALSLFRQGMYKDALAWFEKALNICDNSDHAETYAAYAFSLLQIDKRKCREELNTLIEDDTANMEIDKFTLAYLCNDLQAAERQIKSMLEHFSIDLEQMSMVFDCLFRLNKRDEATEYLERKIEELEESDYNVKPEIRRLKKVFSQDEYRKEIISSLQFVRPLIKQCCYYGCKQHNPL